MERRRPGYVIEDGKPPAKIHESTAGESTDMSPYAPKHPCGFPGCPFLIDTKDRLCERHLAQERKEIDLKRGSAASRGYDARWRTARERYLTLHPLCEECKRHRRLTAATVVDHILPHKGDWKRFWDERNWQDLCRSCHSSKTAASLDSHAKGWN
jgi:5-methylcytosine-specific restriction protein A